MDETTQTTDTAQTGTALGVQDTKSTDTTQPADTKTTDTKATDTKVADKATDTKAADETAKAVEYKFTAPEGVTLDEKAVASYTELAKKFAISPEGAQELLNLHGEQIKAMAKAGSDANAKLWLDTQAAWKKELDADPIFGGSNATAAQVVLGRALDEYGSKEARQAFDLTGAGNNPHIVRMFYNMAKLLDEGGPTPAGKPPGQKGQTIGQIFYPEKTN